MDAGSAVLWIIFVVLLVIVVYLVVRFIRSIRGRRRALTEKYGYLPSHINLYFEEHFSTLISEWDLITKPKLEGWKQGIQGKLKTIGSGINEISEYRKSLDSRIDKLEKEVIKLEKK